MLRTIIIEDETSSQETLHNYLNQYCSDVKVVALAANIKEGKSAIELHDPDLVFLDVEMPYGNGFDLLESMDQINFQTVFVTAFSHYAIRAIQYSASNYILKPIDIDELINAVEKVKNQDKSSLNSTKILLENIKNTTKQATKIVLPVLDGLEIIQARSIIYCEASDNFTKFIMDDGQKFMICRTLKHYQEILEPLGFLRIHKSYLINMEHIRKYVKGKGGFTIMSNQEELPVSPAQKNTLIGKLTA